MYVCFSDETEKCLCLGFLFFFFHFFCFCPAEADRRRMNEKRERQRKRYEQGGKHQQAYFFSSLHSRQERLIELLGSVATPEVEKKGGRGA